MEFKFELGELVADKITDKVQLKRKTDERINHKVKLPVGLKNTHRKTKKKR